MTTPVFRFAPSPNGRLHLGHAYSALANDAWARRLGGRLLLRMEDIDRARCRPDYEAAIADDLAWLGLAWEAPVRRQSEHMADYAAAARRLRAAGLVYPCFCGRGEVRSAVEGRERRSGERWPRDPDGAPLYPGTCRGLPPAEAARRIAAGQAHAWRLGMAAALAAAGRPAWRRFDEARERDAESRPEDWGDAVLLRRDVPASYHLAVVVDDALQGVTHVVRGRDLERATDLHALLQRLLGLPSPLYHHHAVLTDEGGAKLSKSRGSPSLADRRAAGRSAAGIRRELGFGA